MVVINKVDRDSSRVEDVETEVLPPPYDHRGALGIGLLLGLRSL